jgi:hypothetical protein
MGIRIKDRLELFLLFGEKEFPFAPVNSLDFIHMSSSVRLAVPMLHLKVKDAANWFAKNQVLVDGMIIRIIIKIGDVSKIYQFRLNSFKEEIDSTGPSYEIDGYFDIISWWHSSTQELIKGTSAEVIGRIATRCGFPNYIKNDTADNQVWIQRNMRFHEFANFIARHGYASDSSCMQLAVDLSGALIYKNIIAKAQSVESFDTAKFGNSSLIATDYKMKNRSGLLNALSGYADATIKPSIMSGTVERIATVPVTKLTEKMMVNQAVYNAIEKSRVLFAPIDCGNVHPNYVKAKYQNERIAATYALSLELITPEVTQIKVLDFIDFLSRKTEEKNDKSYSGTYLVTGRVIYVQGINYYEKIEAVRHGLNATVTSQM